MRFAILFMLAIGFSSCSKVEKDKKLIKELLESPEFINLENNKLVLSTFLWRDFMPITEEDGSPLACVNKLTDTNNNGILEEINLKKQYVIHGDEVWEDDYIEVINESEFVLQGFVNGGPKWGPDIEVDVVCEFEYLGNIYRILAKSQMIEATW